MKNTNFDNYKRTNRCNKGHEMKLMNVVPPEYAADDYSGVYCSACSKDINVADGFVHCIPCEWDYCMTCAIK